MKVTIELYGGPNHRDPIPADIDLNIGALRRAQSSTVVDATLILDTISILEAIKRTLKGEQK